MTSKLTREQTQQIIDAADAVITALAGTNDEVHKDDTDKMVRLWDDLNDRYAPPEVVRELARMALAVMDSEPVAVVEPSDYVTAAQLVGEGPARKAVHELYEGALRIGDKLYRHAQQPVVQCVPLGDSPYDVPRSMPSNLREFIDQEIGILFSDDDAQGVWIACRRAAMLNHPSSIQPNTDAAPGAEIKHPSSNSQVIGVDLAFGPDRTVEVRYVAPSGYVMVPKEMTDEIGEAIAMQANCCGGIALDIYDAMLAAAPQEVPDGK
ncbi:TPA: hypothetical protein ACS61N_000317 [Klebsiella oxytoca]